MFSFEGFSTFDFEEGVASASITNNGVTFNSSVTKKLNYPPYVVLLINAESRQIALRICDQSEKGAVTFYKERKKGVLSVRWNARDLLNTIRSVTGWNLEKESYRVEGVLLKEENAMLFDLKSAIPIL